MHMELPLILLLAVAIVAFLVVLDRRDARATQERATHRAEVAQLCQRIQAPEQAVIEHVAGSVPNAPSFVPVDDDDAYYDELEDRGIEVAA